MNGINRDLLIAVIILSLLAHVGGMFWARPHIMTHVASGIARIARRGPARVTKASPPAELASALSVQDEKARKDAPDVSAPAALMPSADVSAPETLASSLPAVAIPEVCTRPDVDAALPMFEVASPSVAGRETGPSPKMSFDTGLPLLNGGGVKPAQVAPLAVPAPQVFDEVVFAPAPKESEVLAPMPIETVSAKPEKNFAPVSEVMQNVDEKVVEAEKSAVRALLDGNNALDLDKAAKLSLAHCFEGGFTYFKIVVMPRDRLPAVPKDVVILMDASGSIGQDRLARCRQHARRILRSAMNTGDRFNLVAFRDRFTYAFKSWQSCETGSYEAADRWMAKLAAHGRTDVFASVASVLTLPRDPARPLIALMVTDGEANSGVRDTADILSKFAKLNDGLISVYMYGVKSSANRTLIDQLTRGNRGECLVFEGWRWNAGEGLEGFSERFRDPIVTDLRLVFPSSCPAEAYPRQLRNLYRGNTVTIFGRVPGTPAEIAFSLRGIAGSVAYDGFYRMPLAKAARDTTLPRRWREERAIQEGEK